MKDKTAEKSIQEKIAAYQKPMERMYYVFLALILLYDRLANTLFISWLRYQVGLALGEVDPALVELLFNSVCNIRFLIIIPAVYTVLFEVKEKKQQILLTGMLLLGWFYAFYWRERNDTVVFEALVLIVASHGRDFKKIAKTGMMLTLMVLLMAFLLSVTGIWPDYIDVRNGFSRHAFGTFHCTDLAAQWGFLILLYMFLKNGALRYYDYLVVVVLTVLNLLLVDGRNTYLCVILATTGSVLCTVGRKKQWKFPKWTVTGGKSVLVSAFCILAAVYFGLNATYTEDPDMFYNRFGFLSSLAFRLRVTSSVTKVLPFSWFGKYFLQIGAGFGVNAQNTGLYTFLDCSYMRVYVMYGVVAFVVFLAIFTGIQLRLLRKKQVFRMFIVAVVALHSFMEHRLIDMAYDLFLLLLFAEIPQTDDIVLGEETKEDGKEECK